MGRALEAFGPRAKATLAAYARALGRESVNYVREVRASKRRLFIKSRVPNEARSKRELFSEALAHPIAVAFDTKTELTAPASAALWLGLVTIPGTALWVINSERHLAQASGVSRLFPGTSYVTSLVQQGALDPTEADALLAEHRERLIAWAAMDSDLALLPRVKALVSGGTISEAEASWLNRAAQKSFLEGLARWKREDALGNKGFDLSTAVTQGLFERISAESSPLRQKSDPEKGLYLTAFWPEVKLGKHSDLSLLRQIVTNAKSSGPFAPVAQALERGEIDLATAVIWAGEISDHASRWLEKKAEVKKILPPEFSELAARPDLPVFSRAGLEFDQDGGGHTKAVWKTEAQAWAYLLKDARFDDIARAFRNREISDIAAMRELEERVEGLNELFELRRSEPERLSLSKLSELYRAGMAGALGTYVGQLSRGIGALVEQAGGDAESLSPSELKCFAKGIRSWGDYYADEAKLALDPKETPQSFEALSRKRADTQVQKFQEQIRSCLGAR